ncbi:GNAT family N-acetyltransferase [Pseudoalteromonas obscura]|nr:GNAT family N-acetyltransferase [Pseudoalteromonas sp. P94(2023)]
MQDCKPFSLKPQLAGLKIARHRQLLLLCGSRDWGMRCFLQLAQSAEQLILSDDASWPEALWPQHLHQILGQEFEFVLYDGYSGIIPNKLAACTGTVKAGGLLVLLLPELSALSTWCDPALARWLSEGEQTHKSPFLARLAHHLQRQQCWLFSEQGGPKLPTTYSASCQTQNLTSQSQAVSQIVTHLQQHPNTPVLLSADRGRGKSAALGLIAAQFAGKNIVLCAQQRRAVQNGFIHFCNALGLTPPEINKNQVSTLSYIPPDILLATQPAIDILLVDEAAAIPVPLLKQLLARYPRVIFASTLVGYEGNGRGYTLRFQDDLKSKHPDYLDLHLAEPIRYAQGDPLEQHMRQLLALDCQYATLSPQLDKISYLSVDNNVLIENEALLEQVFALLVLAHYQTSVNDLRQLLDSPSNRLFIAFQNNHPVAVCLVNLEGALDGDLAAHIALGTRRPAGHLMAQQLSQLMGNSKFCTHRGARIARIAVAPSHQKYGIGSALIRFSMHQLADKVSYFGSSFGAQANLLDFWQNLGFKPLKLGFKQDKASGEFAVLVVHKDSQIDIKLELSTFAEQLYFALSELYAQLPWQLVRSFLCSAPNKDLSESQLKQLAYLKSKLANEQQIAPFVEQLIKTQPSIINSLSKIAQQYVILLLLQRHQPKELPQELRLQSKKQVQQAYQSLLSEVYAEIISKSDPH